MITAFNLVYPMRRVLSDQLLLDVRREHVVFNRLNEVSVDSPIIFWCQREFLHDRSQRDWSHGHHGQCNVLSLHNRNQLATHLMLEAKHWQEISSMSRGIWYFPCAWNEYTTILSLYTYSEFASDFHAEVFYKYRFTLDLFLIST